MDCDAAVANRLGSLFALANVDRARGDNADRNGNVIFPQENNDILLPAKKSTPNLYKITKAAAARSLTLAAFCIEDSVINCVK